MFTALQEIFNDKHPADKVIGRHLKTNRKWGSHDRRAFAEGIYDITRWYIRIAYAAGCAPDFSKNSYMRVIEAWALLNDVTVDKTVKSFEFDPARTAERYDDPSISRADRESVPKWIDELGEKELGSEWPKILSALNTTAPIFIRANRLKTTPEQLLKDLRNEKLKVEPVAGDTLELLQRTSIFSSKTFGSGHFEMQDLNSQEVAPALELKPGMRVVDACAGAGGKTLHMAALMKNKGKILALDITPVKLERLRERATRAGATSIETRVIESTKTVKRLKETADRVLLDVPCSGLGVLRRNPDAKWKLQPEDLERLAVIQRDILRVYSQMVKPGGALVYSTCSILPSENSERVKEFLSQNDTFKLDFERAILPEADGGDGFYLARLRKS